MPEATVRNIRVTDMTRQRELVCGVPVEATFGECLDSILAELHLPSNPEGEATVWSGRLEREGRHIHSSEIVGDALQENDEVVIQRDIQAG